MTIPPHVPTPANPIKKRSSGTVALIFGIILSFIAFVYGGLRLVFALAAAIIQADAYIFGQAIGTLIFVAVFGVPGILLLRRYNRIRRANKEAIEAAIWELEYEAEQGDDVDIDIDIEKDAPRSAPPAQQSPPAYGPASTAPPIPPASAAHPAPSTPPVTPPA
jgi:hypothetical protein